MRAQPTSRALPRLQASPLPAGQAVQPDRTGPARSSALAVVGIVGRIVAVFSLLMTVPLVFALSSHDPAEAAFLQAAAITAFVGIATSVATRRYRRELQPRDGFLLVTLTWTLLPAFGALPLLLAIPGLSFTDAYFEAMSGLTTTGATVLTGLEKLPVSINVWRGFMVLVGGMGIIVLVVADRKSVV